MPAAIVEPLIARQSLMWHWKIFGRKLRLSRLLIIFAFGLLHGLGFAAVLYDIGLPNTDFLISLISFNVGVELGQITVIAAALMLSRLVPALARWLPAFYRCSRILGDRRYRNRHSG